MLVFPFSSGSDFARKSLDTQIALASAVCARFFDASLQLGHLNSQAGRRLVEESASNLQRLLRMRSPVDIQAFLGEQATAGIDRMRGYTEHLQRIATGTWALPDAELQTSHRPAMAGQPAEKDSGSGAQQASGAHPGQHEVNVHPSPLVEKLVAAVAVEPPEQRPGKRDGG